VTTAAVTLSAVTRTFPGLVAPALDGISGTIRTGVITGVAGPDGAGKTTLMRLMAGLLGRDSGQLSVLGLDPARRSGGLRDTVGYMPQKFGLYEDLSVQENLTLHADLRGVTGAARDGTFARLLAFTDLAAFVRARDPKRIGLKGSWTQVYRLFSPSEARAKTCEYIHDPAQLIGKIAARYQRAAPGAAVDAEQGYDLDAKVPTYRGEFLVFAEREGDGVRTVSLELIAKARRLADSLGSRI